MNVLPFSRNIPFLGALFIFGTVDYLEYDSTVACLEFNTPYTCMVSNAEYPDYSDLAESARKFASYC